jgi:hypothetical protein
MMRRPELKNEFHTDEGDLDVGLQEAPGEVQDVVPCF